MAGLRMPRYPPAAQITSAGRRLLAPTRMFWDTPILFGPDKVNDREISRLQDVPLSSSTGQVVFAICFVPQI